jgi:hypothetical protein
MMLAEEADELIARWRMDENSTYQSWFFGRRD